MVLFHHLANSLDYEFKIRHFLLSMGKLGWSGVELFFVLSGFLITGILYDSKEAPGYFRNFYARRLLRIFPLYYAALLVFAILHGLWPAGFSFGRGEHWAWLATYMTNAAIAWKGPGAFGMLEHLWSLAVEEHFYLLWPVVVWSLTRGQLMKAAAAVWAISLGLRVMAVLSGVSPDAVYVATPFRLDALLTGGFLALAVRDRESVVLDRLIHPSRLAAVGSALALALLIAARKSVSHNDPVMQSFGFSLLNIFFGSLLILGISSRPLKQTFSLPVLRWFGKYSYGLYVWHPIVFMFFFHTEMGRSWRVGTGTTAMASSVGAALVVTLAITLTSWHGLEKHFLTLKRYFSDEAAQATATQTSPRQ